MSDLFATLHTVREITAIPIMVLMVWTILSQRRTIKRFRSGGGEPSVSITRKRADELSMSAEHRRTPLKVTHEFYEDLVQMAADDHSPNGVTAGTSVIVVDDGTENVKMIGGVWTFAPEGDRS